MRRGGYRARRQARHDHGLFFPVQADAAANGQNGAARRNEPDHGGQIGQWGDYRCGPFALSLS
ncbi:MAG: hypothetical protein CL510_11025, partial [Actinobacteria bacterium]|nr:hypothetical protein [Actinomycetota bacterium]